MDMQSAGVPGTVELRTRGIAPYCSGSRNKRCNYLFLIQNLRGRNYWPASCYPEMSEPKFHLQFCRESARYVSTVQSSATLKKSLFRGR